MSAKDIILNVRIDGASEEIKHLNALQEEINALAAQKKKLNEDNKTLEKSYKDLNQALKDGKITQEQYLAQEDALTQQTKELAAQQVELNVVTKETKKEYSEAEKALLNQGKAMDVAEGSIAAMRLELSKSQKEYIGLSKAERENEQIGGVLQKRIKAQSDELKALEKEIGITSRSVGDYGLAFESVLPLMGGFGQQIQSVISTLGQLKTVLNVLKGAIFSQSSAIRANTASQTAQTAATQSAAAAEGLNAAAVSANTTAVNINTSATIAGAEAEAVNTAATIENTVSTSSNTVATAANSNAITAATNRTSGFVKALRFLKIAFASTGIGAVVLVLGSLVAAIATTERGLDKLSSILIPIKEVFASLFGLLQKTGLKIFDELSAAIDNPKKAIKSLIESFKNAAKGLNSVLTNIKDTVVGSFVVLGLEIKKAFADVPLLGKGIDKAQLEKDLKAAKASVIKAAQEVKGAVTPTTLINTSKEAYKRGQQIFELQERIEDTEISLNREREKANRLIQEQREIAKDVDSSNKEKIAATNEAIRLLDEITAKEKANLKDKYDLLVLEHKANDSREEGRKAEQDALAEIEALESDAIKQKIKLRKDANGVIKQERADAIKAAQEDKKRLEEAQKAQLEAQKSNEQAKIDAENKVYDATITNLESERKLEALTTVETAEQKYEKELELQKKLADLRFQQAQFNANMELKQTQRVIDEKLRLGEISLEEATTQRTRAEREAGQKVKEVEMQNYIDTETIKREERDRQNELNLEQQKEYDEKDNERKKQVAEQEKQIKQNLLSAVDQFQNIIFQNQNRRVDQGLKREIDALMLKKQQGLITEEQYDKERLKIEKKAFDKKKKIDTAQALINGALAITRIAADVPKGDYGIATGILIGAQIIQTGAQVAAIQSQEFEKGGLLQGASHANGGIKAGGVEFEGGEAVINKKSTAMFGAELSAINQAGGGVPIPSSKGLRRFANRGVFNGGSQMNIDLSNIEQRVIDAVTSGVGAIQVVNNATDTAKKANRVKEIQNIASF